MELPDKEDSDLHKPFTREEVDELWRHKEETGAKVALILCYTGLKMKTADVHLSERYMQGGIKTKAGKNRMIPIAEKILPLVEGFYTTANKYLLTVDGEAILTGRLLRLKIWDKSPLFSEHLPHDGRHTCATLMDDAEIPLKIRQRILGHRSQDITSRVYTHKTLEQLIEAINLI